MAGDRLGVASAPPRLPGPGPGPSRQGLLHALWFGRGFRAGSSETNGCPLRQGARQGPPRRSESPEFEMVDEGERRRSTGSRGARVRAHEACPSGVGVIPARSSSQRVAAPDILPDGIRRQRPPRRWPRPTVRPLPEHWTMDAARRRFAFEDFFVLQVSRAAVGGRLGSRSLARAPGVLPRGLPRALPFALTSAQERVWSEIRQTSRRFPEPAPAGDVGSARRSCWDGPPDGRKPGARRSSWRRPRSSPSNTSGRSRPSSPLGLGRAAVRRPAGASARPRWSPSQRRRRGDARLIQETVEPSAYLGRRRRAHRFAFSSARVRGRASTHTCW